MRDVNAWEQDQGIRFIKFWLSISEDEQRARIVKREKSPLTNWKLSPNDWEAHKKWRLFTSYKEQMFRKTSTHQCPWVVINSDIKMIGRLNAMRYVLSAIDYENKKVLKPKKWSKDSPSYNLIINNIKFEDLNKEQ